MQSRSRTGTPRAGAASRAKAASGSTPLSSGVKTGDLVRTPRPYEFGGNLGTAFWTFFIPICVVYAYGVNVIGKGVLQVPDGAFWRKLILELPDGIAVRPTRDGFLLLSGWVLLQFVMQQFMPGQTVEGSKLKNGRHLPYKLNGWRSWCSTWVLVAYGMYTGHLDPTILYKNFGSLMAWANIFAHTVALYLYVHFGLLWRRWQNSPEFEADWGVFSLRDFFHDYWMGTARNPRVFHFLGYPFDFKFFFEARPGLILWVLINWSNVAAMYHGCQVSKSGRVACSAEGDWSRVPYAMLIISVSQTYYIFDYFWNEVALLTTTDIVHEPFGFMLMWGDMGFLPWMYTNSFTGWFVAAKPRYAGNFALPIDVVCILLLLGAMILFRQANSQKNNFRTYVREHGNKFTGFKIWGKDVTCVQTKQGNLMLTSGFWGWCRHPNYMPDMIMALVWFLLCAGSNIGSNTVPIVPFGYVIYFWSMDIHRFHRDEHRCKAKYGDDWDKYVKAVPYCLIPGVW